MTDVTFGRDPADMPARSHPEAEQALVIAEGVGRAFGSGASTVVAVQGVDARVDVGQRIVIEGPSGSGKSTLLHLLAGLDRPTVGSITWPALGGEPLAMRAGTVGVVFQGPSLLPSLDAMENVTLPLLLAGVPADEAARVAAEALDAVGVLDVASQLPDELSGGQAQRVAVARALAGSPQLIVADEPTGQLDHAAAADVLSALEASAAASGAALIVSTHDRTVSSRFACRWTMSDGRLTPEC
jgi:ABC-type lipoprotein export system ATPase subunit